MDGFDSDNEDQTPALHTDFTVALGQQYALNTSSRQHYISTAQQCPLPHPSLPMNIISTSDFVRVQLCNNLECNLNTAKILR